MICAAVAFALIAGLCRQPSALAAADVTVQAEEAGASENAFERPSTTQSVAPSGAVEPQNIASPDAAQSAAEGFAFPESEEVFDLILRLQRKRDVIAPAIVGLQKNFDYYLPMLEIARAVKFPAEAELASGVISGTFINDQNTFSLNAVTGVATVRGEPFELPADSIIVRDLGQGLGDIYVKPEILNKIWPLELEVDFSELTVKITTRQKLSYELEEERKKRQQALAAAENEEAFPPNFEYIPNDYKYYTPPVFTIDESLRWDGEESALTNNLVVSGKNDLMGTTADYTANLFSEGGKPLDLLDLRLRFTREDFGTGTLPLGLKLVQAGDVSAKPSPLIDKILPGRGLYISSDPKNRNQSFDEITVEGTAQPGWEVEIYRGQELLDFTTVDERGQYSFDNIPLNYGNNEIRTVLYGPQGQIEERVEDYSIGRNLLTPGETNFEAGIVDFRKDLIPIGNDEDSGDGPNSGLAQTARVNRGFTHWLTGFISATQTPTKEGEKRYVTAGGLVRALGGRGQVEVYKDLEGGAVLDTRFARSFAGINFNLRSSVFRDFESREAGFGEGAKTFEGEFRAGKSFNLPFGQLALNTGIMQTNYKNDKRTTQLRNMQSLSLDYMQFSNLINTNISNGENAQSAGTLTLGTSFNQYWRFRTALDYDISPDYGLDVSRSELRYLPNAKFSTSLNVNQGIKDKDRTEIGLGASYDFGTFLGGFDVDWEKDGGLDVLLRASTTFGPDGGKDGKNQKYHFNTEYEGHQTALKVRLYQDNNLNNVFDAGDVPVKGAKVKINGLLTNASDKDGYIETLGAGAPGLANVTIYQDSMPDAFLAPYKDGYRTVLRPGTKPFIDFALIQTGVIDGTVRFADGRPIPGLKIQLVSTAGGAPIMETTTAYDGFYVFEYVRPGTYSVQVDPTHRVNVPPMTVSVTSEEIFAYGKDLILLEQAAEVSAADEADGESGKVAQLHHAPVAEGTLQPAPYYSGDGVQPVVRAVRIGEHPHTVRLVLDLSAPASYEIQKQDGGKVILIDLPGTAWNAERNYSPDPDAMIQGFEALALPGGGTRLRIESTAGIDVFYNALLPPEADKGHRLYVDFMRIAD